MHPDNQQDLLKDLTIPPRPDVVNVMFAELRKDEPNLKRVSAAIVKDPGISAGIIRAANSPFCGVSRRISSLPKAIEVLGLRYVTNLASGLAIRYAMQNNHKGPSLDAFWQRTENTAMLCHYIARRLHGISPDDAFSYGLFHDCGIPLLIQRFPHYAETARRANDANFVGTCQVEESETGTSHSILGYFLARAWFLPDDMCQAILIHHDARAYVDRKTDDSVRDLVGIGKLAEHIQLRWLGHAGDPEWGRFGGPVTKHFGLADEDISDLADGGRAALFGDA